MQDISMDAPPGLLTKRTRTRGIAGYKAMTHIHDALDELALIRQLITELAKYVPPEKIDAILKIINSAANGERALLTIPQEQREEDEQR